MPRPPRPHLQRPRSATAIRTARRCDPGGARAGMEPSRAPTIAFLLCGPLPHGTSTRRAVTTRTGSSARTAPSSRLGSSSRLGGRAMPGSTPSTSTHRWLPPPRRRLLGHLDLGRPILSSPFVHDDGPPEGGPCTEKTGGVLLSQALASQVPSALRGLTALFGMGRGVSPSLKPPEKGERPRLRSFKTAQRHNEYQKIRQALDQLVPVSCRRYRPSRSGLSTWWSTRGLTPSRGWESSS
jgi:hypothetical protein